VNVFEFKIVFQGTQKKIFQNPYRMLTWMAV